MNCSLIKKLPECILAYNCLMQDSIEFRSAVVAGAEQIADLYDQSLSRVDSTDLIPWEDRISDVDTWSVVAVQNGVIMLYRS